MSGWIKLHRRFLDWEWFEDSNMVKMFIYFLIEANHEPKNWRGIQINRGQLVTGRHSLSEKLQMSEMTIRTCINRLKSTNEVTIKSTNKFSIITVCNYDKYQLSESQSNQQTNQQANQQTTNKQPATNQQTTTPKEVKKERNTIIKEERNLAQQVSPFFKPCLDIYFDFVRNQLNTEPIINGGEGAALKGIISALEKVQAVKDGQKQVPEVWQFILDNYDKWDKFHQKNIKLVGILSNLTNIINGIKGNNTAKIGRLSVADLERFVRGEGK